MAPTNPQLPLELKPNHVGAVSIPFGRDELFLVRIDGEVELLVPMDAPLGWRYRVLLVPATFYDQRALLGAGHILPGGHPRGVQMVRGGEMARFEFEVVAITQHGRRCVLASAIDARWPRLFDLQH